MVGQAFDAEGGEMNQAGVGESLARESMVDASRLIALSGSFEGIGLSTPRRFIPEVTPAKGVNPFNELRAPLLILRRVCVEVADHEGALIRIPTHPWLELLEGLPLLSLGRHVDGRDGDSVNAAANPVVLELIALSAEARVGLQLKLAVEPDVALPAMKGSP